MTKVTEHGAETLDSRWGEASPTHDPQLLAHFRPRPTDVLITTPPKAGTTWMQQILYQLHSGGDADFSSIDAVVPWLERPRVGIAWRDRLTQFEAMPDPRLFKTHCTYPQTPGGVDVARIVLTSRDPRDCCVSFYHHLLDFTDEMRARVGIPKPESFDAYFEDWLAIGTWYRNVQSWWPYRHHPNLLWLRYEDMKRDLPTNIDRVAAFLGWTIPADRRSIIFEQCSFEWMKAHADKFTRQSDDNTHQFKRGGLIRKGRVGDYRSLLSPTQQRRILDKAREMLEPEALTFLRLEV